MTLDQQRNPPVLHGRAPLLPSMLLALAPVCDLTRLATPDPSPALLAFYFSLFGAIAAAVVVLPDLIDWLDTGRHGGRHGGRHSAAGRAAATSLYLRLGAVALLGLGAAVRLHAGAARFAGGPFLLALLGALAWFAGGERRRRYQPIGLPLSC